MATLTNIRGQVGTGSTPATYTAETSGGLVTIPATAINSATAIIVWEAVNVAQQYDHCYVYAYSKGTAVITAGVVQVKDPTGTPTEVDYEIDVPPKSRTLIGETRIAEQKQIKVFNAAATNDLKIEVIVGRGDNS